MSKIMDLLQEKAALVKEMRAGLEANPGDKWNAECEATWGTQNKRLGEIETESAAIRADEATRAERARLLDEAEQRSREHGQNMPSNNRQEHRQQPQGDRAAVALQAWLRAGEGADLSAEHRAACQELGVNPNTREIALNLRNDYGDPAWCVGGNQGRRELRAGLDVGTSGAGQETIPRGFLAELDRKLLAFGGPRAVCNVIRTASGNTIDVPKVDDTSNTGVLLAEATTIGTSVDPTFSAVTLGAYKYSSKAVLVSAEILQDSAFNMATLIASLLGERLGRIMGAQNTTGTGSSQPQGIVTGSAAGVTAASATAIASDEVFGLIHSVDPAYRMSGACGFMMNDNVLLMIRKLKDTTNQYLWQPGLSQGTPDRLLGYPVTINQHMDLTPATTDKVMLFGDFSHFTIRDVAEIRFRRLDERYADTDQVGFVAFARMDSKMIQSAAIKHLVMA